MIRRSLSCIHPPVGASRNVAAIRTAILCAILTCVFPSGGQAVGITTEIRITAVVPAHAQLKILRQPSQIVVTDADLRRGFLQIDYATLLEIHTNSPAGCMLSIEAFDMPFKETVVHVLGRELQLGRNGGLVTLPITGKANVALGFRFGLSSDTQPGIYPWPFDLSVQPR